MPTDPDDLAAWIHELRSRVARGELDGEGTIAIGGGECRSGSPPASCWPTWTTTTP